MDKDAYIKVSLAMIKKHGERQAVLYSFLRNLSRIWKKDEHGYMSIWTQYIADQLGWAKNTVYSVQEKLVKAGLIDYIPGRNQNIQPRYKVL